MWDHPNPIFVDFETQSACDIKEYGGRLYAGHESTRILLLVYCYLGDNANGNDALSYRYNVWVPDWIDVGSDFSPSQSQRWPASFKPTNEVTIYRGKTIPQDLFDLIEKGNPLVAHNAYGFDRFIWDRFIECRPEWLDSLPIARAYGRPGGLDAISKSLLGSGKDHAKKLLPLLTTAKLGICPYTRGNTYLYPRLAVGNFLAFMRYAVADVELMRRIWVNDFENVCVDADTIGLNDRINQRGVMLDGNLADALWEVSQYTQETAATEIARLTEGDVIQITKENIRSHIQMHKWLESFGVRLVDNNGHPCLRKEVVQKVIDSPYIIEDHLTAAIEIPPKVIQVLDLRMKALRITDAKLKRAKKRTGPDGRIRDLHSYHVALTGRFSSSGVQIHNLPRPIDEIDIERLLKEVDWTSRERKELFDSIKTRIPEKTATGRKITVDDVCSALIRPMFVPKKGFQFAIADFAQIEARLAAWAADEKKLTHAFLEGRDPYKEFAAKLFNVNFSEVTKLQRQIAKSAILGCQYSIGPDKLRVYAANMGADLVKAGISAEELVEGYRNEYTKICGFKPDRGSNFRVEGVWQKSDKGVKECVDKGTPQFIAKCKFQMVKGDLTCQLPSGRVIFYPRARIADVIPPYVYTLGLPQIPKSTVQYDGAYGPKSLYGGLIFENVIQAMAVDILTHALGLIESEGIETCLDIHDETVNEVPDATAERDLYTVVRCMSTVPEWATGLPLECEGFLAPRFVKKPFEGWLKISTKDVKNVSKVA